MTDKQAPDWERIEADYRAGLLSLREMAEVHGGSPAGILKRANRLGWERNLAAKIDAKAQALVNKEAVNTSVNSEQAVSEKQIVEENARIKADTIIRQRRDIARGNIMVVNLMAKLEAEIGGHELFVEFGEMMRNPNEFGQDKLNDLYQKIISVPGLIDNAKKLSEAMKNFIGMERDAYGLAEAQKIEITGKDGGSLMFDLSSASDLKASVRGKS